MSNPYRILERKRLGEPLSDAEIRAIVDGAINGSWRDVQLSAFLMAAAIHGLDESETRSLTLAMLQSGEQWDLSAEVPVLTDKHSTGGVGDKVSLVLAPLLAACGLPVVMLTGRALGHTGGTADKLETIPGLNLGLDKARSLELLEKVQLAIGIATSEIAPADRILYGLRDQTATVASLPLITASILCKKLATGAAAIVFDVKTGNGAFLSDEGEARSLAELLVRTTESLGRKASALITDMSQPLGEWVGHTAEIKETLECLAGEGSADIAEIVFALALELAELAGAALTRSDLEDAIDAGRARETFDRWAHSQGADAGWLAAPDLTLAGSEHSIEAQDDGVLAGVATRSLGMLMGEASLDDSGTAHCIDPRVALRYRVRIGQSVRAGDELARLYLSRSDPGLVSEIAKCFEVAEEGKAPTLIRGRVTA